MCRKVAGIAAIVWLMATSRVLALGLGDIEVHSALNEPFRAVVGLTSASDEELEQLKVKLASREAFQRAGIPRPLILSDFQFQVERTDTGRPVIRISTRDAVDEPFLDFLLEAAWSKGRLVRQYTVLIDPPYTMPAAPVAPRAPRTQAPAVEPAPAPEREAARPTPAAAPPAVSPPASVPARPAASAPARPAASPAPAADRYGPVKRNETLWTIASKLRPDREVSVQQMMLALQRSNPQAFTDNNINNLRAGAVLAVPDREEIMSLSRSGALQEARRQYEQWKAARGAQSTDTATTESPEAAGETTESRLQLVPPEEEVTGEAGAGASAPDLSDTERESAQTAPEEAPDLQQQVTRMAEEAEASRAQSSELLNRVSELEEQVASMQRLLELKDSQLASMQNRLEAEQETPAQARGAADAASSAEGTASQETAEAREVDEPNGLIDRLLDNPVLTALGVLVAMILGGFLWASTRQRRNDDLFSEEPTLASRLSESMAETQSAGPEIVVKENRVFNELPEDISPLESDTESDPLAEADVFIAYGRVQQAEDVIKDALKRSPENLDLKVKLMEVYHAAGNAAAFDTHAEGLRRQVNQDDPLWMKVATMGHELSPENPAYKIAAAHKTDSDVDFEMDLSGMEEIEQKAEEKASVDEGLGLDYLDREQAGDVQPEEVDFNLEDLEQDTAREDAAADQETEEGILDSGDEVGTKLDLARAYIDMGDPDSARNILEEVLEEGNPEQRNEAEDLVSQIA